MPSYRRTVLFVESQSGRVENQHHKKISEDTLTLDAVVKKLTPIVLSQPTIENASNPVEVNNVSGSNNNETSSETQQVYDR